MPRSRSLAALAAASLLAAGLAAEAEAAAFQLREGSAAAVGAALAGRTSGDRDVSFAIHNPAALRGVDRFAVSFGAAGVFPQGEAAAGPAARAAAGPLGLDTEDDYNESAVVPSFVVGWRPVERLVLGFSMDSSFGLANEYDKDFIGAFDGVRSGMLTLNATPMVAYDPVPGLTLAAGLAAQYADAELSTLFPTGPGSFGVADISGDGVDVGFNIGAILEPTLTTTIGVNFQSGFSHDLKGEFSSSFPFFGGGAGRAEFDLPPTFSVGVTQAITPDLRVMAEGEFAGWSDFETLRIVDEETGAIIDDPQDYEDSFMVALGGEYDLSDRLTLRAGLAYDETPTAEAFRTVRVPDGDRYWLSAGFSLELTARVGVDLGYTYIHIEDREVRLRAGPAAGAEIDYVDGAVHEIAANLRYAF